MLGSWRAARGVPPAALWVCGGKPMEQAPSWEPGPAPGPGSQPSPSICTSTVPAWGRRPGPGMPEGVLALSHANPPRDRKTEAQGGAALTSDPWSPAQRVQEGAADLRKGTFGTLHASFALS